MIIKIVNVFGGIEIYAAAGRFGKAPKAKAAESRAKTLRKEIKSDA